VAPEKEPSVTGWRFFYICPVYTDMPLFVMYQLLNAITILLDPAIIILLSLLTFTSCEEATRSGFDEKKTLLIFGYVLDVETKKGLAGAKVWFYSISDDSVLAVYTDEEGAYSMKTFIVYCVDFVPTPDKLDRFFIPHDRYFISATKAGYDTVSFGAFGANVQCFDIAQQVDFRLHHLNHPLSK